MQQTQTQYELPIKYPVFVIFFVKISRLINYTSTQTRHLSERCFVIIITNANSSENI